MLFKCTKTSLSNISGKSLDIPGDKSISHRAAIIGSLAENDSVFENFLAATDCLNTCESLNQLGANCQISEGRLYVKGYGLQGFTPPNKALDVGNSGTAIRLLTGVLAGQPFSTCISGDSSIAKRPMARVLNPLRDMGAVIHGLDQNSETYPPLHINPSLGLEAINYTLPVASAQVKSAVLLAGLWAKGHTQVVSPEPSRDHTERLLALFGARIKTEGLITSLKPGVSLRNPSPSKSLYIPSDISSALFFIILGLIYPKAKLKLRGIGLNPTRAAVLNHLKNMQAGISLRNKSGETYEPYGDVSVEGSLLQNKSIPKGLIPNMIDEIPILAILAMFSEGDWVVSGASELRVKESDRIAAIVRMVKAMGGTIQETEDGFSMPGKQCIKPFTFHSGGDHRLAMSAIIAALAAGVDAVIEDIDCINTSFPSFFELLKKLGAGFELK